MMDILTEQVFQNVEAITDADAESEVLADLAGYQVTKAELFAHTREPAVTIWESRIKFNMACLRRFPGVTHIQILIHPEQKRLIIRRCQPDAPDSLRWTVLKRKNTSVHILPMQDVTRNCLRAVR